MTAIPHNMPRGRRGIQSAFADIRADYDATRQSRFVRRRTGVSPQGSGSDYHFRNEGAYYALAEQARDMDRNDSLVGILADRRVDNIVQGGFTLDPNTGDKKLNTDLWQWWDDFSNDPDQCDIAGECTWKEIERQACRSESIDGDIVVTGTEDGSFQMIESHLIRTKTTTPDTFLGVTTDSNGKRHQYHVAEETGVFGQFGDSTPIEVRDSSGVRQVFHVYNPKRVNVTRGVTQLAPVFSISGMLEDINFAKLVQQQVVSCFAILRETAAGTSAIPSVDGGYGDDSTETTSSGTRQLEGVSPGMQVDGGPGVTLKGFSPNVPNSEYFQQVKLILQIMGVNFGLPLCLVLMDGSETNFSGWRGAVDEARKGFVADQLNLVRRLNKPAYNWKLRQYIESGDAGSAMRTQARKLGDAFYRHNWNLPTWSYIEPVADSEGDASQIRNTQTSPRRQRASRGMDWETIVEESVEDNAYAISAASKQADKINAQFPDSPKLTWRDLISLPMPAGQTMALQDPAAIEAQAKAASADGTPQPTGEMAGLSTLQFTRNKKAIKKMLQELASGAETEAATRAYLSSIGLTPETIDVLVKDAIDGTIDTPELLDVSPSAAKKKDDPRAGFCPTGPGGGVDNTCGSGGVSKEKQAATGPFVGGRKHVDVKPFSTHEEMESTFGDALSSAPSLSESEVQSRKEAVKQVVSNMPQTAVEHVGNTVKIVTTCGGLGDVSEQFTEITGTKVEADDVIGGLWSTGSGRLTVNGGFEDEGYVDDESSMTKAGIFSHEIGHALDTVGGKFTHSNTPEFTEAFSREISKGQLSEYAATDAQEGFAEFARLVYSSGKSHSEISSKFPLTSKFFKSKGLM